MAPLVVIACGKAKQTRPARALDLYTGSFFREVLAYARTLTPDPRIVVLSGKHGLLRYDRVIAPYEQRMDKPGAITAEQVAAQARALGLSHELNVVGLVGEAGGYAAAVRAVWPHARLPLGEVPDGVGHKMRWLTEQVRKVST